MAIAHPELGMIGEAARQLLVERERLVIAADAAERGGAKVRVRGVVGIARQHGVQRFGGFGKAVLLVIDGGEIGAQIGRATCRERVCQYVSISVADAYLKKKKATTKQ